MRKFSMFLTILITSFVMVLSGLVASPIASASENGNGSISATFPLGSSVLSDAQKAAIKKTVASSGSDVSFIVTGTAGKLPGVSDRWVQRLAKKRAQAIKAYIVSLGVSKENVTTQTKTTEIGIVPKSTGSQPTSAPTVAVTAAAAGSSSGGGSGSGGGGTPAPATCATGATCIVGDTGPGGGKVYYVAAGTSTFPCGPSFTGGCKYLEVAPSGWNGPTDLSKPWAIGDGSGGDGFSPSTTLVPGDLVQTEIEADLKVSTQIGLGYKYSDLIVAQNGTYVETTNNYAAGAARAYRGGSMTDWYLPVIAELNLLCQWNRGVTQDVTTLCAGAGAYNSGTEASASGITTGPYWSASERARTNAFGLSFGIPTGTLSLQSKNVGRPSTPNMYVRPIRAFAPAT